MALTIQKKHQYIEYLGNTISISQLTSISQIESIMGISDDGEGFSSWNYNSSFNSLSELVNQRGYLIVSKVSSPNYPLYTEADSTTQPGRFIEKKLSIVKYTDINNNSYKNISDLPSKDDINQIFSFNIDGSSPTSWSSSTSLNSLNTIENGAIYLIDSKRESLPYSFWSLIPPVTPTITPTTTQTVTPTNTTTPTVTPSITSTPIMTSSITPTPTITPTVTPYPPDASLSIRFDKDIYEFTTNNNNSSMDILLSISLSGQPNNLYRYILSSESDNAVLTFDNPSGVLALEPGNNNYIGKIFSNMKTVTKNGQSIVRCTVTDISTNVSVDTLAIVLLKE